MEERKEFLVYWRDDARAGFATQEEAEAYAREWVGRQPLSSTDTFVVVTVVKEVAK